MKNASGFSRMSNNFAGRGMTIIEVLLAAMLGAFCLCELITFNLATERTVVETYRRVRLKVAADTAARLAERVDSEKVRGLLANAISGNGVSFGSVSAVEIGIRLPEGLEVPEGSFGWVEVRSPGGAAERRVFRNVRKQ